ncbi:hypothetical protein [Methylobacterium brachythecii]|uniref:GtrA family protein n=1 Tax=Methylobacterium brachythecii TaxID=1176177 RepID=A0A7W6AI19_9HYPH|nr:hypothetical protein [Methylobacterium brachythecii]MBB3903103.1 hypothetical protein [Methylobacterium brachythecii]GLS44683.1 hypothetical protein GCM10007884_26710 [Methylobacterium brachythecii]
MAAPSVAASEDAPQRRSLVDSPWLPWGLAAYGLLTLYGTGDLTGALQTLHLGDTDDAMRLVEVRDLVAGQSWFDMVEHRFLPPAGVASHWSRLVDAPLAAAIGVLTPLVGTSLAERITTAFWPPLLFLVYALVLARGTRGLFNGRAAIFAIFAATQTLGLTIQFTPGRIDHHNIQVILLLGVGLCLMQPVRSWRSGAIAGALAAASLAVGLEALPAIALAGLIVVADWCLSARAAMPALAGFGFALTAGTTLLFGIQTAPELWSANACDALSPPWLWLSGIGGLTALAAAVLNPDRKAVRLGLTVGVGLFGIAGFAALFPICLHGPFPGMPDLVRTRWLDQVREMMPIWTLVRATPAEALGLTAALFAAAVAAVVLAATDAAHRRPLTIASLFLALGAVQTCLQLRGAYVASGIVPIIAGICLDRALPLSGTTPAGRMARIALLASVLLLNGRAWLSVGRLGEDMASPATTAQKAGTGEKSCKDAAAFSALGAQPMGTVLAAIDLGPYLLAYTPHSIVAAPYHRATAGLIAGIAVSEGTQEEIRRQAAATGAAYLVLCPATDDEGFAARLVHGETADWLEPVPLDGSPLKAWRIR